jgi:integrase
MGELVALRTGAEDTRRADVQDRRTRKAERVRLTENRIAAFPKPLHGVTYTYDSVVPCLAVRIAASGTRTFEVIKKVHARTRRLSLGRFPGLRLDDARQAAAAILGALAQGRDPFTERKQARARKATLGDLWQAYLAHIKRRNRAWRRDQEKWDRYVEPAMGRTALADITRSDCQSLVDRIGTNRPIAANRTAAFLSSFLGFAVRSSGLASNPAKGLTRFPETARTRVLKADELPRLLDGIEAEGEPWADVFKVLLFTGARRASVVGMRWEDIDLGPALWTIPAKIAKNKTATAVPLIEPAVALLQRRLKRRAGEPWVFPSPVGDGHLVGLRKAWMRILLRANITGLRIHDIRRSVGTALARAGASPHIIATGLGHRTIASAEAYVRLAGEDARQALGNAVTALTSGRSVV